MARDDAAELLLLVESVGRLLAGGRRSRASGLGVPLVQLQALDYLARANRYSNTPRALAEYLGLTKGTVSQSLLLLQRDGLVQREEDPADGRVVRLRLSAKGRRLLERAAEASDWLGEAEALLATEREAAIRALRRLLAGVQRRRSHLSFGECRTCRHHERQGAGSRCGLTGEPLAPAETVQLCREHAWAGEPPGHRP